MSYDAPFAGLKVIDLSQGIAGPYCAMLLAQYGAEVIKVEGIGDGDWARTLGTRYGSEASVDHFALCGMNSITQETLLPHTPDDEANWTSIGYSPARIIFAWRKLVE